MRRQDDLHLIAVVDVISLLMSINVFRYVQLFNFCWHIDLLPGLPTLFESGYGI